MVLKRYYNFDPHPTGIVFSEATFRDGTLFHGPEGQWKSSYLYWEDFCKESLGSSCTETRDDGTVVVSFWEQEQDDDGLDFDDFESDVFGFEII